MTESHQGRGRIKLFRLFLKYGLSVCIEAEGWEQNYNGMSMQQGLLRNRAWQAFHKPCLNRMRNWLEWMQ